MECVSGSRTASAAQQAGGYQRHRRRRDQQRRLLNQAIFHGLYIEDDQVTDHDLHDPFGQLRPSARTRPWAFKRDDYSVAAWQQQKGHPLSGWPFNFRRCPPTQGRSRGQGFQQQP
jgi:hypothetical protein